MTAESSKNGQLDLEKELTCSICTEVLYQPLTLLDCLHTFCGSCLKFWFQWQASQNTDPRKNPYTCPSCRASVRTTSSDAKINTLLEMFLLANPTKGRTEEEKKDVSAKYTRGEDVIPKIKTTRNNADDADRRMVEEVRAMSLREVSDRVHQHGYERGVRHRHRSRERRPGSDDRARSSRSQARHIEHQSSLRSLISTDEVSSSEMTDEILRQISEEGLLDGIDLHTLDTSQVDELSERIAEAYRRRHHRGAQSPRTQHTSGSRPHLSPPEATSRSTVSSSGRRHARSTSATEENHSPSHPPVSHRHLLAGTDAREHSHRRRRSSESRRQTSPNPRAAPVYHQAARSATDLSTSQRHAANRDRRPVELNTQDRRNTDPHTTRNRLSDGAERRRRHDSPSTSPRVTQSSSQTEHPQAALEVDDRRPSASAPEVVETRPASSGTNARSTSAQIPPLIPQPSQPSSASQAAFTPNSRGIPPLYPEPSVTCDRCGKHDLQYELHEHCSVCNNGSFNLCHRCFKEGKGCLNWYGFGDRAWHRFQRSASLQDPPHPLIGRQYLRPHPASVQSSSTNPTSLTTMTTEDPSKRLLSGAFCSTCSSFADDCFWLCTHCNSGEWGYCNTCVNTGQCCNNSHSLLPLAHISAAKSQTAFPSTHPSATFAPITSPAMMFTYPPSNVAASGQYRPLTFSTTCDICHYPVQPSQSRYHCYTCNNGNYDVCTPCYSKLVSSGRISGEDGDKGWRRCLRGHRMIKFFFEDTVQGQCRVIVNDLVGGLFLEDRREDWTWTDANGQQTMEVNWRRKGGKSLSRRMFDGDPASAAAGGSSFSASASASSSAVGVAGERNVMMTKFPPDGGVGMRVIAKYAWIPAEGARDELSFQWGAEISEAANVTPDWCEGAYAGKKGLFPMNHVKVTGVVRM